MAVAAEQGLADRLGFLQNAVGAIAGPFDSFLALRGLKTLHLRMERHSLESCQIFALAESLGGVESLIEHPAIMTHASIPAETRRALGISDTLIRLSVGVEDLEDLQADLVHALAA